MANSPKIQRSKNPTLEKHYALQGSCCYYCKTKFPWELITRDHIIPKRDGGKLKNNSVFACKSCNATKGSKTLEGFKGEVLIRIMKILREIVDNNFTATQSNLDRFKYNYGILRNVVELIENKNVPIFGNVK